MFKFIKKNLKKYIPYYSDLNKRNKYINIASASFRNKRKSSCEKEIFEFIRSSPKVNLVCNESKEIIKSLRFKSNEIFSLNKNNAKFKVATNKEEKLLETFSTEVLEEEIYRFVVDPINFIPEVLDLVLTESFKNTFSNINSLKLANIHLRLSTPNSFEKHTTGFHRDYNSFNTLKIFVPLTENNNEDFLEYFSSTILKSTKNLHYRPRHIPLNKLKNKYRNIKPDRVGKDDNVFPLVSTNCIHREIPSKTKKITLILTFLAHPDYGYYKPIFHYKKHDKYYQKLQNNKFLSLIEFK